MKSFVLGSSFFLFFYVFEGAPLHCHLCSLIRFIQCTQPEMNEYSLWAQTGAESLSQSITAISVRWCDALPVWFFVLLLLLLNETWIAAGHKWRETKIKTRNSSWNRRMAEALPNDGRDHGGCGERDAWERSGDMCVHRKKRIVEFLYGIFSCRFFFFTLWDFSRSVFLVVSRINAMSMCWSIPKTFSFTRARVWRKI